MTRYTLGEIATILQADVQGSLDHPGVEHLLTDSRRLFFPGTTLFFALPGSRRSGSDFIAELWQRGVRAFVVSELPSAKSPEQACYLVVKDPLAALQTVCAHHRRRFDYPVWGITGSNGKTMVKEWLFQLLESDERVVRSPRSYNSQVGVPFSVWQMEPDHTLAIFEAGISKPGEMERLERVIQPETGIMTNLGPAHDEFFEDRQQKFREKCRLFKGCRQVILGVDGFREFRLHQELWKACFPEPVELVTWSREQEATLRIIREEKGHFFTGITAIYNRKEIRVDIPFTDEASIENLILCWLVLLQHGVPQETIAQRMKTLRPLEMRLAWKKGYNDCLVINDSYNADLVSLRIALEFAGQQTVQETKTVILSDILQSGLEPSDLYNEVSRMLVAAGVHRVIAVGEKSSLYLPASLPDHVRLQTFLTTEEALLHLRPSQFQRETILIKGARVFGFERIYHLLEALTHQTVMEVNLGAIAHNLKTFRSSLQPGVRLMVMVKASSYGSGGDEIASLLQYHGVEYVAVAYTDEGVSLRQAGVRLPVMVMNPDEDSFDLLTTYGLEPELYSFSILEAFLQYCKREGLRDYPVHIKLDTGMHRLGFDVREVHTLGEVLRTQEWLGIRSVFSHLVASEDPRHEVFSREQARRFLEACVVLKEMTGRDFIRHLANTAAIQSFPEWQLDMVRLGIGLYGIEAGTGKSFGLEEAVVLKTTIAQVRELQAGDTVGYGRAGVVHRPSRVATIRIGYADGYPRRLGLGKASVLIRGRLAPTIGRVCMDMTMVDITDIPDAREGDEVILWGRDPVPVSQVATWAETIPYELLTQVSSRVRRIYFQE